MNSEPEKPADTAARAAGLRRRAEKRLKKECVQNPEFETVAELRKRLHELEVRRVELEIQNEELRRDQSESLASAKLRTNPTEQTPRATGVQLQMLLHSAPLAMFIRDKNGLITSWNPAAEQIYGWKESEVLGKQVPFYIPALRERAERAVAGVLAGKESAQRDVPHLCKDGTRIIVNVTAAPLRDASGSISGVITIASDISDRKRAEQTQATLAAIVEGTSEAIVGSLIDGTIISWNAAAERMFGYTAAETIGRNALELIVPPERHQEVLTDRKLVRAGQSTPERETVRIARDGRRVEVAVVVSPIKRDGAFVIGAAILFRDIGARKRAEEELRATNEHLQTLIRSAPLAIFTRDRNRLITSWNPAAEEIYGWKEHEVLGKRSPIVPQESREESARVFAEVLAGAERSVWEIQRLRRDGERIFLSAAMAPLRDASGNIRGVITIASDITERKRAEAEIRELNQTLERRVAERTIELEHSNQELESYSYSISHDLRAPLRVINGFASVLDTKESGLSPHGQELLRRIIVNAAKMGQLIDDILGFSRIGRTKFIYTRVDLGALARAVLAELREINSAAEVEIEQLPTVTGDRAMLRQVLANLIGNALKFTAGTEAARITVGTTQTGGETVYHVRDNGAGFDATYANKLFKLFQRLHHESEFPGTGVGLVIVKRIVERHGGRVWAESTLGKGATFYFTLRDHAQPTLGIAHTREAVPRTHDVV